MKKILALQLVLLLSLRVLADPTFETRQVPVNRGGQDGGMITLRFYSDMPSVAYVSISDFQELMLPGTTIAVTKNSGGEYMLQGPCATATVNIDSEQFTSADYMGFTNLMGQLQEGMDNAYYDGAPFVRYRSQELTPASATVSFDFKKYGIDLRGDETMVYFPFATLSDMYSDLYYHIAGFTGEKVIVITENQNSEAAKIEPEAYKNMLATESRSEDMATFSYGELCFVIDHFYGKPGRAILNDVSIYDGLDKALDQVSGGADIKKLLKSTTMKEYFFGLDCLHLLFDDGGHTNLMADMKAYMATAESEEQAGEKWLAEIRKTGVEYPDLLNVLYEYIGTLNNPKEGSIKILRPTEGTYYKVGDTAYVLFDSFGMTNEAAWQAYYQNGCTGPTPAIDEKFRGDLSVVLDAIKQADEDPEVKNLVIDLTCNHGGSLDVVLAMTALMGQQSHFYSENVLTGQRQKIYYDIDCNFDGKFDEQDKAVKYNLTFAVLTTDIAFSCGNLFPSLMKDMGFQILGEKSGGGACAVQNFFTAEGLQYQISSARARLTNDKWENIDGGIEPTTAIEAPGGNYASYYDFALVSDLIKNGSTTGVALIDNGKLIIDNEAGAWYDLQGRRLSGRPTQKGVYICNGRIFVNQ